MELSGKDGEVWPWWKRCVIDRAGVEVPKGMHHSKFELSTQCSSAMPVSLLLCFVMAMDKYPRQSLCLLWFG